VVFVIEGRRSNPACGSRRFHRFELTNAIDFVGAVFFGGAGTFS
jgi:hypothetical protein